MNQNSKIYIAGHQGLVGSALIRALTRAGYANLLTRTLAELDLRDQGAVNQFFVAEKPEYVFLAAARVGGILANATRPAEFIYDNLAIELNVIHAAYTYHVKKLLFLGSSCIYPRDAQQPISENALLSGPLEQTNAPYALAKIAGIGLCQSYNRQYGTDFICAMPTNLYGPGDNFDTLQGHVIPALIAKFCYAVKHSLPEVTVWGTGMVYREFMFVDDCADALLFLMRNAHQNNLTNIGTGSDITIKELVHIIAELTGFTGTIIWDATKPDGTPRKRLEVSKLHQLGWQKTRDLKTGLYETIKWYKDNQEK